MTIERRENGPWIDFPTVTFRVEGAAGVFVTDTVLMLFGGKVASDYISTVMKIDLISGETKSTALQCTGLFGCNPATHDGNSLLLVSNRGKIYQFRAECSEQISELN